jgi:acetyl-CoA carboxylase carboxyl transferase subunit beta
MRLNRGFSPMGFGNGARMIYASGFELRPPEPIIRDLYLMNWISDVVRPRIKTLFKRETPENLWVKCPDTGQMVFHKEVEANLWVIPGSNHHMRINAADRLKITFDGSYETIALPGVTTDPLKFRDEKRYVDRLKDARAKTGMEDAVKVAVGEVDGTLMTVAVQDFSFMGGSLGMAAGEAIITAADTARERGIPLVLFVASGGARMQEGILSLMQMPRTTVALRRLKEARLPYIVVLTNPTTGGVTASYAMLGDVHIAEPGALIGFAGPRVIEQTIREKLPEGFQRAEYLKEHGMVDMVVPRTELKATIANLARIFTRQPAREIVADEAPEPVRPQLADAAAQPAEQGEAAQMVAPETATAPESADASADNAAPPEDAKKT